MGRSPVVFILVCSLMALSCGVVGDHAVSIDERQPVVLGRSRATVRVVAEPSTTAQPQGRPTPTSKTSSPPRRGRLVIQGAGDTNLDPSYIPALRSQGYGHALSGLDGLFLDDSLTVVNLECTPSNEGSRQPRPFNFRCDPNALPFLAEHGVEVVNLANNHSMDYGGEALVDGMTNATDAGLLAIGAGGNRTEAFLPATYNYNGWSIAVLGFGGVYLARDWLATDEHPGMSDGLDLEATVAAIEEAERTHDLVVVTIHWCCELETSPNARNRANAQAFVAAGADVIFGHHHHRLQPLEFIDETPVFWGLGNFVWPRFSSAGSKTAVARVEIDPDGVVIACQLPATIVSSGHPMLDDPTRRRCQASEPQTSEPKNE